MQRRITMIQKLLPIIRKGLEVIRAFGLRTVKQFVGQMPELSDIKEVLKFLGTTSLKPLILRRVAKVSGFILVVDEIMKSRPGNARELGRLLSLAKYASVEATVAGTWLKVFGHLPAQWKEICVGPDAVKALPKAISKVFWKHVSEIKTSHMFQAGWVLIKLLGSDVIRWSQKYGVLFVDRFHGWYNSWEDGLLLPLEKEVKNWLFKKAGSLNNALDLVDWLLKPSNRELWRPDMSREDFLKALGVIEDPEKENDDRGFSLPDPTSPVEERIQGLLLSGYPDDIVAEYEAAVEFYGSHEPSPSPSIPEVVVEDGEYKMYKVRYDDPMHLVFGALTKCCQRVGGIGHECAVHSWVSELGALYVVERKGRIVAGSWTWRNGDIVCFDNIEAYGVNPSVLQSMYKKAAQLMVEADSSITDVRVGLGGDDADILRVASVIEEEEVVYPPEDYDSGYYFDSEEQASLLTNKEEEEAGRGTNQEPTIDALSELALAIAPEAPGYIHCLGHSALWGEEEEYSLTPDEQQLKMVGAVMEWVEKVGGPEELEAFVYAMAILGFCDTNTPTFLREYVGE